MYDVGSSILAQSSLRCRVSGRSVGGAPLPSVRVEVNPDAVNKYGLGFEQIEHRSAPRNANQPQGHSCRSAHAVAVSTTDQLFKAKDYKPLVVAYRNGAPVRCRTWAMSSDSVENIRNAGVFERQDRHPHHGVRAAEGQHHRHGRSRQRLLPQLQASIPPAIHLTVALIEPPPSGIGSRRRDQL